MASDEVCNHHQFANTRIECKSNRSVAVFLDSIEQKISELFDSNLRDIEDAQFLKAQFLQNFKSTLIANLEVNGQPVNLDDLNATSTIDNNAAKAEELTSKVDKQLINTTRLRKTAPVKIKSCIKKQVRHELVYLNKVKVEPAKDCEEVECPALRPWSDNCGDRESQSETEVNNESFKQDCECLLRQGKDLQQAVQYFRRSERSDIQRAITELSPSIQSTLTGWQLEHQHALNMLAI